jgi:hypothetical protein
MFVLTPSTAMRYKIGIPLRGKLALIAKWLALDVEQA